MTAGHFAAALALKARVPKASTSALILGAFIPDFVWIVLCALGVETDGRQPFYDDWSHSLVSIVLYASVFALFFRKQGRAVAFACWLAVFSHFLLDCSVHPKSLALYPHSSTHLTFALLNISRLGGWLVELAVTSVLLGVYAFSVRRLRVPSGPIFATCALVLGWHVILR